MNCPNLIIFGEHGKGQKPYKKINKFCDWLILFDYGARQGGNMLKKTRDPHKVNFHTG